MDDELDRILKQVFAADSKLYGDRGFQRRIGFGKRPALINIDLANAWTRPGHVFSCEGMEVIIPSVQKLLAAARAKNIPIVYTSTAYAVTEGPNTDMGLWHHKIPAELLKLGTPEVAIDDRIAPRPGEHLIVKKRASAFHGTYLAGLLRASRRCRWSIGSSRSSRPACCWRWGWLPWPSIGSERRARASAARQP